MKKLLVISGAGARYSASAQLGEKIAFAVSSLTEMKTTSYQLGQFVYDMAEFIEDGAPSASLAEIFEAVRSADAIIAVSPVFNASYSGVFKMFWDMVEDGDIAATPLILAATGGSARHSLMIEYAMRPLFSYLQAETMTAGVYATPGTLASPDARLEARIEKAAKELVRCLTD